MEMSNICILPIPMDYKIRELKQNEISVLNTFLYEAIFIPDGVDVHHMK